MENLLLLFSAAGAKMEMFEKFIRSLGR